MTQRKPTLKETVSQVLEIQAKKARKDRKNKIKAKKNANSVRRAPAALGRAYNRMSQVYKLQDGSVELLAREVFFINNANAGIDRMIPLTPTKWTSTRAATLASTYMSYRPKDLIVKWVPSVGTSQSGYIAFGTVFNGARLNISESHMEQLTQTLCATNGGFMTTAWNTYASRVTLGRNLDKNNYPLYQVGLDDIPLWMIVAKSDASLTGYLEVTCSFTLRNPINPSDDPPVNGSGVFTFTQGEQYTTAKVLEESVTGKYQAGQDIVLTFQNSLVDAGNKVINKVLTGVVGRISSIADGFINFLLDKAFATQTATGYVVGKAANF